MNQGKSRIPVFTGLGMAIGAALGVALQNIPLFVGAGLAVGAGVGGVLQILERRRAGR
jgi:hypothetical protein